MTPLFLSTIVERTTMPVVAVPAPTFPEGIPEAWSRIEAAYPPRPGRRFYGLTRMEGGGEVYYAAVETDTFSEEPPEGFRRLRVEGGPYARVKLKDWSTQTTRIPEIFAELESRYAARPDGYYIEFYRSQAELHLMVPLTGAPKGGNSIRTEE